MSCRRTVVSSAVISFSISRSNSATCLSTSASLALVCLFRTVLVRAMIDRDKDSDLTARDRVFPNVDSLLRLSTAIPVGIDEKRETETNAYMKWEGLDE